MLTGVEGARSNEVMTLRTFVATIFMTAALSGLPPLRAAQQSGQGPVPARPARQLEQQPPLDPADRTDAPTTRERLREMLNEYPPSLRQVLALDPTLMLNPQYIAPYPRLAAYLTQHPEIPRNPSYFLGEMRYTPQENSRRQSIDAIQETLAGLGVFLFLITAISLAAHVGKSILEHRRWMHATKIQTEAHTKLVDRLASNEELMAYVQSTAGQRFLTSQPIAIEVDARLPGYTAPIGRILTSAQIGIVVAFGGLGLWFAKNRVIDEVAQLLTVISVLAVALGLGFVLSALLSYGLSRQMGLLKTTSNA